MKLVIIAACFAACFAAKLERAYLPPESAKTAGGTSEILQTPFRSANDQGLPAGSYVNEFEGVVIDANAAGTRATHSGLGGSRDSYGSMNSKVGEAAFRDTTNLNQNNQVTHSNSGAIPNVAGFRQPVKQPGGEVSRDAIQMPVLEQERFHAARDRASNIITYQNDIGIKDFNYSYQTDNGISAAENGIAVNGVRSQGGYSYTGDDGQVYTVSYTADEGGYRPQGAHLPTPPPIPVEILKALEQNAKDEAAGIIDDGSYDAQKYNTDDTKGNSANDYNESQYNMPVKGSGLSGVIATINQNSHASSKPNERYQDSTHPSQNNGAQSNQFVSNINNIEYTVNDKQISNLSNINDKDQNGFNSPSISHGSANNNKSPSANPQVLNTLTHTNTAFSADNNKKQFNIPLSQQKLQDQKEIQDSLSGRPSSYEAPITGSVHDHQISNANVFSNQFKNNGNDQSQQTFSQGISSQFLNTNTKPVSEVNNSAYNILVSPFTTGITHVGSTNYQPSQHFGIVSHSSPLADLFDPANKNGQQYQNNIRLSTVSSQNNEDRFHSNAFFLHKQFSLRKQQQANQQALAGFVNPENVANNIPNVFPSFANKDNQYFSTTIKPYFDFTNQYNQNVFNNQPLASTQLFSSTSSELTPSLVSQHTFSPSGSVSDVRPPSPVPSRHLTTPKEDKPETNQASSGLTQASISPFPSIGPSNLNKINGFDTFSEHKNNLPIQVAIGSSINGFLNNPTQITNAQNQGEIYEYQKPDQSLHIASEKPSTLNKNPIDIKLSTQPTNDRMQIQQSAGTTNIPLVQNNFFDHQKQEATASATHQPEIEQSKTESSQANFPKLLPSRPQFPFRSCCSLNHNKDTKLENNNRNYDQSIFGSNNISLRPQGFTNNAQNVVNKIGQQTSQAFDETGYHY